MSLEFKNAVKKLYSSIETDKHFIGVNFIKDEICFENIDAPVPEKQMNYCGMIKAAYIGYSFKARNESFLCLSGPRVLGINKEDIKNSRGENWLRLGLYKDKNTSESIRKNLIYLDEGVIGTETRPVENFTNIPDVIIFAVNPYSAMRIIQGYTYSYGKAKNLELMGNQALCYESTVVPYRNKDINISFLCIGTRHRALWDDNLMAVSLHKSKFIGTVEGIFNTINPMENDKKKRKISENFQKNEIEFNPKYGDNYYKNV